MSYPEEVSVGIIIEPVMHHNVPGTVVVSKGGGVPPVLIIGKRRDYCDCFYWNVHRYFYACVAA